jgi:hypothetical protein
MAGHLNARPEMVLLQPHIRHFNIRALKTGNLNQPIHEMVWYWGSSIQMLTVLMLAILLTFDKFYSSKIIMQILIIELPIRSLILPFKN